MTVSVTKMQKIYRGWVDRQRVKAIKARMVAAAIQMQRVVRGYMGRQWWKFVARTTWAAVKVQRIIRGFVARAQFKRMLEVKHFNEVVIPSCIKIQAVYRRRIAMKIVAAKRAHIYHVKVEVPAAIKIQTLPRMRRCVLLKRRKRKEHFAAIEIQRIARGLGWPARLAAMRKHHYETIAAVRPHALVAACRR